MSVILVLDDHADNRALLATVLGHLGHTVLQAATGEQALDLASTTKPELIIADLVMPGMNGYEFVRELRGKPRLNNTRVVFCTAVYEQSEVRDLAANCGVEHILVKPCEPEEIIRVVGDALASGDGPAPYVVDDEFDREQLRVLNAKLVQKLEELQRANLVSETRSKQLEASLRYKSEFLANMSHELRTPLNSVLILASLLGDNHEQNLTAEQIKYATTIRDSGADLLGLLNDLLALAEIDSSAVTAQINHLGLVEIQDALRRDFGPITDRKGVSFTVELADGVPSHIDTDPTRLRQVLNHLIDNAIKFTERGAIRLLISPTDSGWSTTNAELNRADMVIAFTIQDTGIGMTAEIQEHIFDDFVQGDGTTARQYGGTGLGLSLSRKLTHILGGEITVTSTPEQGSTFTVYTPVTAPRSPVQASVAPPDVRASQPPPHRPPEALVQHSQAPRLPGSGAKALVVDDDPVNVMALTARLQRAGVEVVSADGGEEGVAILERTPDINVAFVDIMMPGMDGYETMGAMRALPGRRDMSIYAVTAKVGNNEAQRCIDAGATAYMSKPIDSALLTRVLTDLG
jgi:signal transduction histidine kinase/DNA-binding LytR/AlgR family response regulator